MLSHYFSTLFGRKNFLFANTPRGAKASAILYSLVETAKECTLDPYKYLTDVLRLASNGNLSDFVFLESLLPASFMTATLI